MKLYRYAGTTLLLMSGTLVYIFRDTLPVRALAVMVVAQGAMLYLAGLGGTRRNLLLVAAGVVIGLTALLWLTYVVRPATPQAKYGTLALAYVMGGALGLLVAPNEAPRQG